MGQIARLPQSLAFRLFLRELLVPRVLQDGHAITLGDEIARRCDPDFDFAGLCDAKRGCGVQGQRL
ncbi:hypothetical protein [Sinorhizobium meliloti]|uniref:hypothetical protein n=1 Tax=Rhizobium meliloti TaxID=382 RepID=UPI000FDC4B1E|nr:hypothetical protein [Sinorhizobium meliloti]RVK37645.1 hypothetical protein CN163_16065 [Sinorhizobium meliloti]